MTTNAQGDPPFSKFSRQAGRVVDAVTHNFTGFVGSDPTWTPCVNLYEVEQAYRVCVDLAGVDKDRIDVTVRPPTKGDELPRLYIGGERPVPRSPVASSPAVSGDGRPASSKSRVHRMEIDHGRFAREVELPADVDHEAISATYRAGLLWIELPKRR